MSVSDDTYRRILEDLHDGVYFTDRRRSITFWNSAAERMSGFAADEVVGRRCGDGVLSHVDGSGERLCGSRCPLAATIVDGVPREAEVYLHHRDGHRVPVSVRVSPLLDEHGEIVGGVELFTDISHREATAMRLDELERISQLDHLTQLPNRRFLEQELAGRTAVLDGEGAGFGVMFLDIDHFKRFNDQHGHGTGDAALRVVARGLLANARAFDVYGRWAGDEFLGVVRDVRPDELRAVADRVRVAIGASTLRDPHAPLDVTVSIGATVARAGERPEDVLARADELLYESKSAGRNRVTVG